MYLQAYLKKNKKHDEKEFIEMDIEKFEPKTLYLIDYQNERYAVQKIDRDHVAFYDVI